MHKCKTCKYNAEAKKSKEPACCAWYIDNVVCGNKTVKDCPVYKKR